MNRDDIWSMYLDSYFAGDDEGVFRALLGLLALPQTDKMWIYDMVAEFEDFMVTVGPEDLVQTYCEVKGVDSTTMSADECRKELEIIVAQAKEVLNG